MACVYVRLFLYYNLCIIKYVVCTGLCTTYYNIQMDSKKKISDILSEKNILLNKIKYSLTILELVFFLMDITNHN